MIPLLRYLGLAVPFKAPLDKLDRLQSVRKAFFDIFQLSLLFDFLSTLTNWPILNFKKSAKDFINLGRRDVAPWFMTVIYEPGFKLTRSLPTVTGSLEKFGTFRQIRVFYQHFTTVLNVLKSSITTYVPTYVPTYYT